MGEMLVCGVSTEYGRQKRAENAHRTAIIRNNHGKAGVGVAEEHHA